VKFFCFRKFESKGMRFVCGIDVAVVSYVCFNVIHHQIETSTSCTVCGVRQNHVVNFFDNDPIKLIFDDKLRSNVCSKVVTVPLRKLSAVFRHRVFSCLFQKTCFVGIALIGSSTRYITWINNVKFTTMGSSGKDFEFLCFWPFAPCRSIFAQNLRDESWSPMCVYSHLCGRPFL
jgi:hypothetical protein